MNLETWQDHPNETEKTEKKLNRTSVNIKQPDTHVIVLPKVGKGGKKEINCVCVCVCVNNGQIFFKSDTNYKPTDPRSSMNSKHKIHEEK